MPGCGGKGRRERRTGRERPPPADEKRVPAPAKLPQLTQLFRADKHPNRSTAAIRARHWRRSWGLTLRPDCPSGMSLGSLPWDDPHDPEADDRLDAQQEPAGTRPCGNSRTPRLSGGKADIDPRLLDDRQTPSAARVVGRGRTGDSVLDHLRSATEAVGEHSFPDATRDRVGLAIGIAPNQHSLG